MVRSLKLSLNYFWLIYLMNPSCPIPHLVSWYFYCVIVACSPWKWKVQARPWWDCLGSGCGSGTKIETIENITKCINFNSYFSVLPGTCEVLSQLLCITIPSLLTSVMCVQCLLCLSPPALLNILSPEMLLADLPLLSIRIPQPWDFLAQWLSHIKWLYPAWALYQWFCCLGLTLPELHGSLFWALCQCSDFLSLWTCYQCCCAIRLPYQCNAMMSSTYDVSSASGTYAYAHLKFPIITLLLYWWR